MQQPEQHGGDVADLLARAASGDEAAWHALVDRYASLVWSIVRGFRLDHASAADVAQTVWLRLVQYLDSINDPARLPGWLSTTTRRECLRALRGRGREIPAAEVWDAPGNLPAADSPEYHLLADERQRLLWAAVTGLSQRCQMLLRIMAYAPEHSYAEISAALDMPVGSIGPTRARCLTQLRSAIEPTGLSNSP